jgi:soluble lytic murein transglycosylase
MLAPAEASPVPQTLERLIYPTPYAPLVVAESRAFDVDPRLLYSLMRQESLFNPGATSWVGARGLAQVMPATGEGIAQNLGVADFHIDDLYRPAVSVRFGAYYIGQSMSSMEGSIHGGLAAYNGGLGNAYRWAGGGSSVADADLFTEFIDYPETETYIKRVYGYYGTYQRLYTLP